ncbi:alpha/beta hydrolase [bacterium]|nr:alpha/beta hydrolase [bacterium]
MRKFIGLFLIVSTVVYPQSPKLWNGLKPGPYAVGFKVINTRDSTRSVESLGALRPIQIGVWYPAVAVSSRMTYGDYIAYSSKETDLTEIEDDEQLKSLEVYGKFLESNGIPTKVVRDWFGSEMFASFNTKEVKGSFPLVIIAQGNFHSAHHQSILAEFLASHGYVVATSPSQTKITGPLKSNDEILPSAIDQKKDMEIIEKRLRQLSFVDNEKTAVVAHSLGARAGLIFINDHPSTMAFVSLDGGIGNKIGKEWISSWKEFKPQSIQTPILHFYENIEEYIVPDFELIESLEHSDRIIAKIDSMHHYYFSSLGFVAAAFPDFDRIASKNLDQKCNAVANATLYFLDQYVKKDANNFQALIKQNADWKYVTAR